MDHSPLPTTSFDPWRYPPADEPRASLVRTPNGHELTIRPGASPAQVAALVVQIPPHAEFAEHHGDVDVTLVFTILTPPAGAGIRPGGGGGVVPDVQAALPAGPIECEPALIPLGDRELALRHAVSGVRLGSYDERIVRWMAAWDGPTVVTVASLIRRARAAERAQLAVPRGA